MTAFEHFMLSVCFGSVIGTFIGIGIAAIVDFLDNRRKRKKAKKSADEAE